jgi:hypothetical protein
VSQRHTNNSQGKAVLRAPTASHPDLLPLPGFMHTVGAHKCVLIDVNRHADWWSGLGAEAPGSESRDRVYVRHVVWRRIILSSTALGSPVAGQGLHH